MKKLFKTIILFSFAFIMSCETQEKTISNLSNSPVTKRFVTINDLNSKPDLLEKIKEFKSINKNSNSEKISYNSQYNFYIDDEKILETEQDGKTWYTIPVLRDSDSNDLENLVLKPITDGKYNPFFVKYNLSETDLYNVQHDIPVQNLGQKTEIIPLDDSSLSNITTNKTSSKSQTSPTNNFTAQIIYNLGDGNCGVVDHIFTGSDNYTYVTFIVVDCPLPETGGGGNSDGSQSSGGGGSIPTYGGSTGTFGNNGDGSSTTGNNNNGGIGNTSSSNYAIITLPVTSLEQQKIKSFMLSLTPAQNSFLNPKAIIQNLNPVNPFRDTILTYLSKNDYSTESKEFAKWAIDYLMANPTVTLKQFINRFMGTSEGQDGDYDTTYWENPNLTFPSQNLPSYNNFVAAFPRNTDGSLMIGANNVYSNIGGAVWQARIDYPNKTGNTCAVKISKALNYSGVIIPNILGQTFKGADQKNYFLNSKKLNVWMCKTFGKPSGLNHITGIQAGIHGVNLPSLLNGKKGIYSLISSDINWAYGHADFLMIDATCGSNCHFYDAPIDYIDIWILN